MIKFMKLWCEGIIVAIVISIIIEMLVPEGNNKKYIKVVVGIYIIFVVLNPILSRLNQDFEIQKIFNTNKTIETSTKVNSNVKDVFINGIEESLKKEIFEMGYLVNNIKLQIDSNYENIEKIEIIISESENISISPIEINVKEEKNSNEFLNIKQYISENYNVELENIKIVKK